MTTNRLFNKDPSEMEEEFRAIRSETLDRIERQMEWESELRKKKMELAQKRSDLEQRIREKVGLDEQLIKEHIELEEKQGEAFVEFSRSRFAQVDPQKNMRARERAVQSTVLTNSGFAFPHFLGTDIVASHSELLEGMGGEGGNPSRWFFDDVRLHRLRIADGGGGSGCAVWLAAPGDEQWRQADAIFHYAWVPPASRTYRVQAYLHYWGFYAIRANDEWWSCKEARVEATAWLEIHQYFSWGRNEQTIVNRAGSNIIEANLLSGPAFWDLSVVLRSGDLVTFEVGLKLRAYADGSGSRALVDFSEGEGNYFMAPVVGVCWP